MASDSCIKRAAATTSQSPEPPEVETIGAGRTASMVVVHSRDAGAVGRRIALDDDVTVVGRDVDGRDGSIDDLQLSRVHFRVVYDGRAESHRVGDAGSRNGTVVDGARVTSAVLRPQTVLRAGETVLVYETHDRMSNIAERVERISSSDLSVLVIGETGTGKERVARAVHHFSKRTGPFVALNCAALPRELLGAELFGHTRGAFSGATSRRDGLFQAADHGTLLLDEIGDLAPDLQAVLLRTLQEGVVRPLGSDTEVRVDVRVVAATHRDLGLNIEEGRFRADLYARVAQAVVHLPPLRERRAEIVSLAREFSRSTPDTELRMTADAAEALTRHGWPFNVRELQSMVRTYVATNPGGVLGLPYLAEHHPEVTAGFRRAGGGHSSATPSGSGRDRAALEQLLSRHKGNVSAAAAELGKPRALVYRWLRHLGLAPERFR